jgi:hypothetical protein
MIIFLVPGNSGKNILPKKETYNKHAKCDEPPRARVQKN